MATKAATGRKRMTQSEVFNHFADKTGMKRGQVKEFFDELYNLASTEVKSNGEFVLPGFGKLVKSERKAREGRNPATGETKEWQSPSGQDTQPYSIIAINDIIWYNESRRRPDALVRFDPKTERFQSWAFPSGVGALRNLRATADGNLLVHQTATNRIGLVTINRSTTPSSR